MIDSKPLSYSAYKRYMQCPKSSEYYYKEGLRPVLTSSALLFGSAVDDMINALLDGLADPWEAFLSAWSDENLDNVEWVKEDYDPDVLSESDRDVILKIVQKTGYRGDDIDGLAKVLLKKSELSQNQRDALRALCKFSLMGKARLMLSKYKRVVMPKIEEVESVQKKISLANGRIMGISDYVATIKGHGRVLLDNKTSKRPYPEDSVKTDPQLALYAAALGCDKAGFVVMVKNLRKNAKYVCDDCSFEGANYMHKSCPAEVNGTRCKGPLTKHSRPEASIQILIDDVPPINKKLIEEAMLAVDRAVHMKVFPRNLTSCGWVYGKPCPYINKCWKDDEKGLVRNETR